MIKSHFLVAGSSWSVWIIYAELFPTEIVMGKKNIPSVATTSKYFCLYSRLFVKIYLFVSSTYFLIIFYFTYSTLKKYYNIFFRKLFQIINYPNTILFFYIYKQNMHDAPLSFAESKCLDALHLREKRKKKKKKL